MDFRPYLRRHLPPLMVAREAEIVEELAQHLEEIYREAIDDGLSHDEAWSRAMAAVPTSTEVSTTELATMTKPTIMTAIGMAIREIRAAINARLALRALFKFPFVTVVAIISLALGIGANTAVFSLFNQWLLQPLPVPEPDRLVNLSARGPEAGTAIVRPGRRLRHRLQLSDVSRSRARADAVHGARRASSYRRQRSAEPGARRRQHAEQPASRRASPRTAPNSPSRSRSRLCRSAARR